MFSDIRKRLERLETLLIGSANTDVLDLLVAKAPAFRAKVQVWLHWDEILNTIIPERPHREKILADFETMSEAHKGRDDLLVAHPLINRETFTFHWFRLPTSPYDIVWSYWDQGFVPKMEVIGKVFGSLYTPWAKVDSPAEERLKGAHAIEHYLRIEPHKLSLEDGYHYSHRSGPIGGPKLTIAEMPFFEIVSLLVALGKEAGHMEGHAIARFPDELAFKLTQSGFTYELDSLGREDYGIALPFDRQRTYDVFNKSAWATKNSVSLYESLVKFHVFKSKWYTVMLEMDVF